MTQKKSEEEMSDEEYEAESDRLIAERDEKAAPLIAYFIGYDEAEDPDAFRQASSPLRPE